MSHRLGPSTEANDAASWLGASARAAQGNGDADNHSRVVIKLGSIPNYPVPAIILITMIACDNDNLLHLAVIGAVGRVGDVELGHRGELRQLGPGLGERELLGGGELRELRPLRVGALPGHGVLQQHLLDGLPHLQQGKRSQFSVYRER